MTIRNCTFSGNKSIDGPGTAIYHSRSGPAGSLTITSSTVVNNSTAINWPFYAVHNQGNGSLVLESSIVTGNRDQGGNARDISSLSTVTANYCAIGSPTGFSMTGNGNLAFGLDLLLGLLADNGGSTLKHAIPSDSPALDTGLNFPGIITDQRGFDRNVGQGVDIGAFELQRPPCVADVIINDGAIQRSIVTMLEVVFAGPPVTFAGGLNAAFQLNRVGPTGQTGDVELSATQNGNRVVLQFLANGTVPLDPGNSLIDGSYQLIIVANGVSAEGGLLDGNNDGVGGDNFETPTIANAPYRIFRLFGDINGEGSVAANDFLVFRQSFGGVNASLDFDNDGAVAASDFIQFRLRFGSGI